MAYATATELKLELQDSADPSAWDTLYESLVAEASESIDRYCRRSFVVPTVATDQYFFPTVSGVELYGLRDIANTTGLVVARDGNGDGTYSTAMTEGTDYILWSDNLTGMVTNIVSVGTFYRGSGNRPPYKVTARYGWPSVPGPVHRACIILARRLWNRKETPSGILGFGDMGAVKLSAVDPDVQALLGPYRDISRMVG